MRRVSQFWLCLSAVALSLTLGVPASVAAEPTPLDDEGILDLSLEDLLAIPSVVSVSLRNQSLHEAPSSVTVIREEQIRASGANSVGELLRLVPGMHVMQLTGNTYSIGLRGIARPINDRVLILVDGFPYKDQLTGESGLESMYLHPLDVERIEVIRGPGSVIYGAGALSGVVNIITKKPGANGTVDASAWGGIGAGKSSQHVGSAPPRNSGGARVVYNAQNTGNTLGGRVGLSMNHNSEWPDGAASTSVPSPGSYGYSAFAAGQYRVSDKLHMDLGAFHTSTEGTSLSDISNVPAVFKTSMQQLSYRTEKKGLLDDSLDVSFSVRGRRSTKQSPATTVQAIDYNAANVDSSLQFTLGLFENRNITTGAYQFGFMHATGYSCAPTLLSNGLVLNNDTYAFERKLVMSLGSRFDNIASRDDALGEAVHHVFSYRGALTWRFTQAHAVRISGSSSFRVPSPYETFAEVNPVSELSKLAAGVPPIRLVIGNPRLMPEHVASLETGYRGQLFERLHVDVVVFGQEVTNLIANDPVNGEPAFKINRFNYRQVGLEAGVKWYPTATSSAYLNYSFVYGSDKDSGQRMREFPAHIGGLGGEIRLPWQSRLTMDTYWVFDYRPNVTHLNPGASRPVLFNEQRNAVDQMCVNLRAGHLLYDDKVEVFVMGKNLTAFARDVWDLRMYPIDGVQPVGATILAGVNLNSN